MTVEPMKGTEPTAEEMPGQPEESAPTTGPGEAAAPAQTAVAVEDPSVDRMLDAADDVAAPDAASPEAADDGGAMAAASGVLAGQAPSAEGQALAGSISAPEGDEQDQDKAASDMSSNEPATATLESSADGAPIDDASAVADSSAAVEADPSAAAEADSSVAAETPPTAPIDDRPEPTTMEELLSEQPDEIRSLKHGDVVEGQVVRIDKDEILVDIGAKSEGVVSNRELYGRNAESQPQLDIGDTVLVYVLQPESNEGHAVLSLRRAGLERKWRSMQEQLDAGVIIEAPVIDHNKGGLIVDCGIRGFVPISQIVDFPRRPQNEQPRDAAQEIAEKLQPYVGRKLRLKILEVNRKANRLILSEKVALYEERREKRDELFSSLQVGQKVTGNVRSIAPFGVFVDLGGIDGLVHKSELSWNKVNNPEAGYRVGEEVEAEVIDINHERGRISLSIRRLQPDPWASTVADLKVGDVIEGVVTKIVNFGAFVRVRDGLEGLIHISELSHQRVAHPGDVVNEGQKIDLKVISLDSERHRLGLSLKQAEEAPARPAPSEPRERRGRSGGPAYDPAQAVQEPEEGIDNTLAAAFAAVRQQVADSEAAESGTEATAEAAAEATVEPATDAGTEATAEPANEPATEPATAEGATEAGTEPATDAIAEPAADEASDSTAEPPTESAGPATEATAEPSTYEASDATAGPATEATAEPATEATAQPSTDEASEATAEPPTESAGPATEATAESASDESVEPSSEPTVQGGSDSAASKESGPPA